MNKIISDNANQDLNKMDNNIKILFLKILKNTDFRESQKHLLFNLPFFIKKVSKQSRIIFEIKNNEIIILRCFATHKQYEK